MNMIPYVSWKGKTLTQITSGIKMNKNTGTPSPFRAQPLKIYRKEIASTPLDHPFVQRSRISIDEMNSPNGYIISQSKTDANGLDFTLDAKEANITDNSTYNGSCEALSTHGLCLTVENNARRRVRSAGMSRPAPSGQGLGNSYNFDTRQYLASRNKTFGQNQFNYFRSGVDKEKPGSSETIENVYSPGGVNRCKKFHIVQDTILQYQWIRGTNRGNNDTTPTNVIIPAGYYSSDEVNQLLKNTMAFNEHYYINQNSRSFVYLLNIEFNDKTGKIELQTFLSNNILFPSSMFVTGNVANYFISDAAVDTFCPFFIIPQSLSIALGFPAGNYPGIPGSTPTTLQTVAFNNSNNKLSLIINASSTPPGITPSPYVKSYYKPNNPQFAQQGAVTASSLITRVKYNSITSNAFKYQGVLGSSVANAMAYSGDDSMPYTLKNKIGFQTNKTPVFDNNGFKGVSASCVRVRR
jgi:hypothetical protein